MREVVLYEGASKHDLVVSGLFSMAHILRIHGGLTLTHCPTPYSIGNV